MRADQASFIENVSKLYKFCCRISWQERTTKITKEKKEKKKEKTDRHFLIRDETMSRLLLFMVNLSLPFLSIALEIFFGGKRTGKKRMKN